jgi:ABC-type transport system involved in cytochrome bd biosynthesis fused ATPase/permease subunit
MHFEPRLWIFTEGVRLRILWAVFVGLVAVALGVARLGLLGWLIGEVFAGRDLAFLALPIGGIAAVIVLRGVFEHWRTMIAHETAARVQKRLRRRVYDRIAELGPAAVGAQRSGAVTLSLIDGVEQLETYFGQFLPQFLISLLTPLLIFGVVGLVDLPVAAVMLGFALVALFAPALWHGATSRPRSVAKRPMPPSRPSSWTRSRAWPRSRPSGKARRAPRSSSSRRATSSSAPCGCLPPT